MKIRGTTSNDLDLNKCYPDHNPEQYSRAFSRRSDLDSVNASDAVTCKPYNSKST